MNETNISEFVNITSDTTLPQNISTLVNITSNSTLPPLPPLRPIFKPPKFDGKFNFTGRDQISNGRGSSPKK